jgi:hypothetical protein
MDSATDVSLIMWQSRVSIAVMASGTVQKSTALPGAVNARIFRVKDWRFSATPML